MYLGRTSLATRRGILECVRQPVSVSQRRNFSFEPQLVVNTLTESIQAVHTFTGIPWWALIPLTTFSLRAMWTLPLAVMQRKRIQKQNEFRPVVSAMFPVMKLKLAQKVQAAKQRAASLASKPVSTDSIELSVLESQSPIASMKYEEIVLLATKERRKRQKALFKKHNIQLWKNFILPAFQIPLWVCMSLTMRNLSGWSTWDSTSNTPLDPLLREEGLLWFTDLTHFDSLHIIPVVLGVISLCNVEWTFKTLELLKTSRSRVLRPTMMDSIANISRMSVVFMMAISMNAPVALTLYWLSSQLFSLVQNIFLDLNFPMSFTPKTRFNYRKTNGEAKSVIREGEEKQ
ncbi:cytochrome c oxidase assembly protein Cox18p, mitochondrial [[Candida] anglica]